MNRPSVAGAVLQTPPSLIAQLHIEPNESHFYHGPDDSRAMVMWPPIQGISQYLTNRQEQTCLQGLQLE